MRVTVFIILVAISFLIYHYGNDVYNRIKYNLAQKRQIENLEQKLDSLYLENTKIIRTLSREKDSIYLIIRDYKHVTDTIYSNAETYVVPEEPDSIIKELERLVNNE